MAMARVLPGHVEVSEIGGDPYSVKQKNVGSSVVFGKSMVVKEVEVSLGFFFISQHIIGIA